MFDAKAIKKVKFEYHEPLNYKPLYVNGIIGGPSAKGDIVINFFLECNILPESQIFTLEDGKMGPELSDRRRPAPIQGDIFTVQRKIETGVIMNLIEAKGLHKWLGEQIAMVEENAQKKQL